MYHSMSVILFLSIILMIVFTQYQVSRTIYRRAADLIGVSQDSLIEGKNVEPLQGDSTQYSPIESCRI